MPLRVSPDSEIAKILTRLKSLEDLIESIESQGIISSGTILMEWVGTKISKPRTVKLPGTKTVAFCATPINAEAMVDITAQIPSAVTFELISPLAVAAGVHTETDWIAVTT